ncbi:S-layer homology domain-containing protein [Calidifontibacillus oryziterrae]|uniref:S-layer homology domain-containing protein n=1 Tax=Calidifontibacillus oryziterrae TaxID=1191699 RepID=UPI000311F125|nr:S-layer homology domain-containing protein [Calidifontibacillus oryziterrae]
MKNWIKKSIPLAVAASLATTAIPYGVDAKVNGNGKGNGNGNAKWAQILKSKPTKKVNFKDVRQHWALTEIEKIAALNLIRGYEDFSFQPNKPVTQGEAVSLIVRVLEMEEGESLKSNLNPFNGNWASNSFGIAIERGLLENTKNINPNKPATRLFVTTLLVKLLGEKFDVELDDITFTDIDELSDQEKSLLLFAAMNNLVTGYGDGKFQPNKPVTRAEMAVFLNRLLDLKVELEDDDDSDDDTDDKKSYQGVIESIDDDEITIELKKKVNGEWKYYDEEYELSNDVKIYIDGKRARIRDLEEDMTITFELNKAEEITILKAKSASDDKEITNLLKQIDDVDSIDIRILGDDAFYLEIFYERKSSTTFTAKVIVKGNTTINKSGIEALEYLVEFLNDYSIKLTEDDVEIKELKADLVDQFDIENPVFNGSVVVDNTAYGLK